MSLEKIKEMKSLFLIRSPLQAFNAMEAKKYFSSNDAIVIVFYRKEMDKELMLKTLSHSSWSKIIVKKLKPHYHLFNFFKTFLKEYPTINVCFIGDYSTLINYYMNRLEYNKLILLEDGTATLRQVKLLENNTIHKIKKTKYSQKNSLTIFIEKLFAIDNSYLYKAIFFTIYNIKTQFPIIKNDYKYFKKQISYFPKKNVVYFIGSNLIEGILISDKTFENYLHKVIMYYKEKNIEVVYVLHRKEDAVYMDGLALKLQFSCVKFDNIIEVEFLNLKYTPVEVSTFLSTAITTLSNLYPSNYTFFKIKTEHINQKFKKPVEVLTQYFEEQGFTSNIRS